MLFALLLAAPLTFQVPSEKVEPRIQSAILAANAERPIAPRATERAALTGTEGITLHGFRAILRSSGPYFEITTAQQVLVDARSYRDTYGAASEIAMQANGWSLLMLNYAYAVLLGEPWTAQNFRTEAAKLLLRVNQGEEGYEPSSINDWFGTYASREAKSTALAFCALLRDQARVVAGEAVYLTDSLDPEGYVRQQLQMVSTQLALIADTLFETSQAFAY